MSCYAEGRALLDRGELDAAETILTKGFTSGEIKCAYGLFVHALMSGGDVGCALKRLGENLAKMQEIAAFDGESAFIVGRCYEMGCAVDANEKLAIRFYQLAAKAGNTDAAFNLGCIYANKNETQTAITYFRQVKVSGSAEADEYLRKLEGRQC